MSALADAAHRPWPMPSGPWVMTQSWCDLAFLHWPVPAAKLRPLIPAGLEIDEYDGTAWVGLVPFRMEGIRFRLLPRIPWTHAFLEMNVRTYVTAEGKPGVWFLSLDAENSLGVAVGRRWFGLPYYRAEMGLKADGEGFRYASRRSHRGATDAVFRGSYHPDGPVIHARPGTLEAFLAERYCLYAPSPGGIVRGDVHHAPWPLRRGRVEIEEESAVAAAGVEVKGPPPVVHFATRVDSVVWPPRKLGAS